jgi:hypothetical protein
MFNQEILVSDSMAEWLTHQNSNFMIASRMGFNPIRGKFLFPWARNFTQLAEYWLVPEMDFESVSVSLL